MRINIFNNQIYFETEKIIINKNQTIFRDKNALAKSKIPIGI